MRPTIEQLHRALGGEITRGKSGRPQVRCPGPNHSAKDRSLAVATGDGDDGFVVYSFSGDDVIACKDFVRSKLGLPRFGANGNGKIEHRILATYDYTDESGKLLYQALRFEPKDFRQRRPDGEGGWVWKLDDVRRVLYRLPELTEALANDRPVFVVEGEKDVDALWNIGIPATCNPQGAGKWRDEYSGHFKGATVHVIPDNDDPGRAHPDCPSRAMCLIGSMLAVRRSNFMPLRNCQRRNRRARDRA